MSDRREERREEIKCGFDRLIEDLARDIKDVLGDIEQLEKFKDIFEDFEHLEKPLKDVLDDIRKRCKKHSDCDEDRKRK